MNELGSFLRELRGNRSLREIAEITGLSHSYIADVEKGYRRGTKKPIKPSFDTLKRLAKAYDYDYEKLLEIAGYLDEEEKIQVAGTEVELTEEEFKVLEEIKKHPVLFHDLANAPEKKIKQLIKMWEFIKKDLDDDEDNEDIIDD
ncbi:helix-turn-helix transcriptional regulator [Fictibacillus sp. Mic-4]|uniref:helix-turn-helix domain-containing protein n=1 Tax=Fictibacillus sp. Mic-4 TaxID=3132826 RepID=UPI003CF6B080